MMLEKNIIRKKQGNKLLKLKLKLDVRENKDYKVETIKNSNIHVNKTTRSQLLGFYYLIF